MHVFLYLNVPCLGTCPDSSPWPFSGVDQWQSSATLQAFWPKLSQIQIRLKSHAGVSNMLLVQLQHTVNQEWDCLKKHKHLVNTACLFCKKLECISVFISGTKSLSLISWDDCTVPLLKTIKKKSSVKLIIMLFFLTYHIFNSKLRTIYHVSHDNCLFSRCNHWSFSFKIEL